MENRVLVIQAARFGDLMQTGRLMGSLFQKKAEIHLAVDHSLAPLANIIYPDAIIHGFGFHGQGDNLHNCAKSLAKLRDIGCRAIYNCNYSPLSSAICRIFANERIIGNRPAHVSAGGITRSPWCRVAFRLGARRYATPLNLVDFWGYFHKNPISPQAVNPVAKGGGRGIGIAVAGREDRRSMPLKALALAAQVAFNIKGAPPIRLFGTQGEAPRARKLMRLLPAPMLAKITDFCGKTDWQALVEEISGLDLLLTPDTGLMHLACHLGVPVLAFFLSSAWCHETGPYGEGHIILQAAPPCSPCLESAPCDENGLCRQVFDSAAFGKITAMALGAGKCDLPPDFQLWRSKIDAFGAYLELQGGVDKFAGARWQTRQFLQNYLGRPAMPEPEITKELEPSSEWMLPPWRYC